MGGNECTLFVFLTFLPQNGFTDIRSTRAQVLLAFQNFIIASSVPWVML